MPTILLMRHAKASPAAPGMDDFDRPLEASGRADAAAIGKLMATRWGLPQRIVCSPAKRTRETLAALGLPESGVVFAKTLYEGQAAEYLEALRQADAASILLIGHNPSIQGATLALVGGGDEAASEALRKGMPTAGLAVLECQGALSALEPRRCVLEAFFTPADLRAA